MRSRWIVLVVTILLIGQVTSTILEVRGTPPGSTTDGNYALHIRNIVSGDHGFATTDEFNTTGMMCIDSWGPSCAPDSYSNRTDSIQASLYVSSVQFQQPYSSNLNMNQAFNLNLTNYGCYLSLAVYRSDKGLFLESTGQTANITQYWTTNSWLQLEAHVNRTSYSNKAGTFRQLTVQSYINGSKVGDAGLVGPTCKMGGYIGPASGRTSIRVGMSALGEVYVDSIVLTINGQLRYSQGFENGLAGCIVDRTGQSTVDTTYFGPGPGRTSTGTTLSITPSTVTPANQSGLDRAVNYKSAPILAVKVYPSVQMHGIVYDLTYQKGVGSATVVLEYAQFSQVELINQIGTLIVPGAFQSLGTTLTDQNGNFSLTWKPIPHSGPWLVRARFDGNAGLFGSSTYAIIPTVVSVESHITVHFSTYVGVAGLQVNLYGNITGFEGRPVIDVDVVLRYTVGPVRGLITSVRTDANGKYSALWKPSASGNYTLQAYWGGDDTYFGSSATSTPLIIGDSFAQATQFLVQNSIPLVAIGAGGVGGFFLWRNMRSARRKQSLGKPPTTQISQVLSLADIRV